MQSDVRNEEWAFAMRERWKRCVTPGEFNDGQFSYNRDGKRGKVRIAIDLLANSAGEPLVVGVFFGNSDRNPHRARSMVT